MVNLFIPVLHGPDLWKFQKFREFFIVTRLPAWKNEKQINKYSTEDVGMAASTLIIVFSEMLKFSKLINYWTHMCWSPQGTRVVCNLLRFLKYIVYTIDCCMGGFYNILECLLTLVRGGDRCLIVLRFFLDLSGPGFRRVFKTWLSSLIYFQIIF
jgi:hypothetical protein